MGIEPFAGSASLAFEGDICLKPGIPPSSGCSGLIFSGSSVVIACAGVEGLIVGGASAAGVTRP
jgi:hypothetical protein